MIKFFKKRTGEYPETIEPAASIFSRLVHYRWPTKLPTIDLLGMRINAVTQAQAVQHVMDQLQLGRGGWIVAPNLDHLRKVAHDRKVRALYEHPTLTIADGMPLVWASYVQGTPLPGRTTGTDIVEALAESAARRGFSIYLLGGAEGTAQGAAEFLKRKFPNLRIAGWYRPEKFPEVGKDEIRKIGNLLRHANPDIIFVCFGAPKQEQIIKQLRGILPHAWWSGNGAVFSFLCGQLKRAPTWMQKIGLEWLHRLIQQPRWLAKRYLILGIPFFFELFFRSLLRHFANTDHPHLRYEPVNRRDAA